jgi:hypothetical protein
MPRTHERITEQVGWSSGIDPPRLSAAFAKHNAAITIDYIRQVRELGI